MKLQHFIKALISLIIAVICYAAVMTVFVAVPVALCILYSWWWLIIAIPSVFISWWLTFELGWKVEDIWR